MLTPAKYRYDSKVLFGLAAIFYRLTLRCLLVPISYYGKENLPNEAAIFVGNHQSAMDVPLMGVLTRGVPHIWLAWKDLMKSPILRFILPRVAVLVDTTTPMTAVRSLLQVISLTNSHKRHIMIFPEGGRYTDGKVHDFFGGFVVLAKKLGRPVIPVYIKDIQRVYPPFAFLIRYYPVKVTIGKPMLYTEQDTDATFKNRIYAWFCEQEQA